MSYPGEYGLPMQPAEINRLTRSVTWLLIAVSTGLVVARIWTCHSPDPKRPVPFMSANDRSRWCTIRSLVDHGTFAIDPVVSGINGAWWDTIDKVRHVGPDGQMHFYSSKPVLWPTILAGQYWLIQQATGWTLERDLFWVVRLMLILNNAVALALLVWCLGRIAEYITDNPASRCFVVATGAMGTFLTPFCVTLNNHVPSAAMIAISLLILLRVMRSEANWLLYFLLGVFASFAATMELPATGWLTICSVIALSRSLGKTLLGFGLGVVLIAAGFGGANYLAHGDLRMPYAHRGDGSVIANVSGDFAARLDEGMLPKELVDAIAANKLPSEIEVDEAAAVTKRVGTNESSNARQWVINEDSPGQLLVEQVATGYQLRRWDNWYDYPGSYWRVDNDRKSAVDRGEPDRGKYLLHMTVGHHGVLSLSPVFLLSLLGILPLCFSSRYRIQFLSLATLALTVVVFAFYFFRDQPERSYGGMTSGLRWMFWLYPIWLVWMIPPLERASRYRLLWLLAIGLLMISTASALYSMDNPWVHPWLYEWLQANGGGVVSG